MLWFDSLTRLLSARRSRGCRRTQCWPLVTQAHGTVETPRQRNIIWRKNQENKIIRCPSDLLIPPVYHQPETRFWQLNWSDLYFHLSYTIIHWVHAILAQAVIRVESQLYMNSVWYNRMLPLIQQVTDFSSEDSELPMCKFATLKVWRNRSRW